MKSNFSRDCIHARLYAANHPPLTSRLFFLHPLNSIPPRICFVNRFITASYSQYYELNNFSNHVLLTYARKIYYEKWWIQGLNKNTFSLILINRKYRDDWKSKRANVFNAQKSLLNCDVLRGEYCPWSHSSETGTNNPLCNSRSRSLTLPSSHNPEQTSTSARFHLGNL